MAQKYHTMKNHQRLLITFDNAFPIKVSITELNKVIYDAGHLAAALAAVNALDIIRGHAVKHFSKSTCQAWTHLMGTWNGTAVAIEILPKEKN